MLRNYTAKYIKISSGYMGQLIEWPEAVSYTHLTLPTILLV